MAEFKREIKYLVLKWDDIDKYLTQTDFAKTLLALVSHIVHCRRLDGKKENTYVVVNEEELYAEIVWKLIELGENYKDDLD